MGISLLAGPQPPVILKRGLWAKQVAPMITSSLKIYTYFIQVMADL